MKLKSINNDQVYLIANEQEKLGVVIAVLYLLWVEFITNSKIAILHNYVYSGIVRWCFLYVPFFIIGMFVFRDMFFKTIESETVKKYTCLTLKNFIITFVLSIAYYFIAELLLPKSWMVDLNKDSVSDIVATSQIGIITLIVIFIAPVVEETVFRFIIFGIMRKRFFVLAHIASAIIFGFYHVCDYIILEHNFTQVIAMVGYVIGGLGLSITYEKTHDIRYSLLFHMVQNSLSMLALCL